MWYFLSYFDNHVLSSIKQLSIGTTKTDNGFKLEYTNIPMKLCDRQKMKEIDSHGFLEKTGFMNYLFCPVNDDFVLRGNYASDPYKFVTINLK